MPLNKSLGEKVTRIKSAVAAGTDDVQTSSTVDMAGYEGCKFYVLMGTITATAVTTVSVQQSANDSSYADLEGSGVSLTPATDDNKVVVIDVFRPTDRYLQVDVTRATANAVIDGIIAVQYGAKKLPTTDDTTTVDSREVHVSPAEGTA